MADGRTTPPGRTGLLTRAVGRVALTASRYAKTSLLVVLVLTVWLGYGATKLTTNVDVADVLPRGDYNTTAAQELTKDFKSAFTLQITLQFHVDEADLDRDGRGDTWEKDNVQKIPGRRTTPNSRNITDEVYIRAIAQAIAYMRTQDELICCSINLADLFKLINWTLGDEQGRGGQTADDSAYDLPGTNLDGEVRYASVHNAAQQAIYSALDALASPTWRDTAALLTPEPDVEASTAEIGRRAIEARDAYVRWATANPDVAYQVFTGDNYPRLTVELPVANAHSSALTKEDFSRLLPIVALFILVCLFIAFRNLGAVVISFSSLALGTLWTYGVEGYLGIALNPLNLTLMPLIMGIGIDYSIHIANEFQEHKSRGISHTAAFREVGRRAGTALLIATLTTVVGLAIMIVSPSLLIAEYGILASLSICIMYFLSIVYIPAALTLWPHSERMGASFYPSRVIPFIARRISAARFIVLPGVLLLTVVGTVASFALYNEPFGDPGRNYLRDDPIRIEHETGLKWFYDQSEPDVKANVITFQGDILDPAAHSYMRAIERELKKQPRIIADTLRTIPFLIETWMTVKDGGPGAVNYLAQGRAGAPPYPQTRDDIKNELDALYDSPVKELGSIFTNGPQGGYDLGVMTFSARAATYEEAEQVWNQVWDAIGNASAQQPSGLKVAFVGNTATNYLFVAKEVPWVGYMGTASSLFLFLFLIPFFRSWKPLAAIMLVNFATIAWWLGILPQLDIGLAITLVLPLIFISAVGTDYAVHLAWSIRQVGDPEEVYRTTGKAILFSWITAMGPFIIFMWIQDLSVRKTMIATSLAVLLIFVVTLLTIPCFFPTGRKAREPDEFLIEEPPVILPPQAVTESKPHKVSVPAPSKR